MLDLLDHVANYWAAMRLSRAKMISYIEPSPSHKRKK